MTLRLRLAMLWLFTLAVCIALGFIIRSVYQLGAEAQTSRAAGLATSSCAALAGEYSSSKTGGVQPDTVLMSALLNTVLDLTPGIEGGFWHEPAGFVAYAFPTHQGSEAKRDMPATERGRIEALLRRAFGEDKPLVEIQEGTRETLVLAACPVLPTSAGVGAWTMARVPLASGKAYDAVSRGLGLLLVFVVGSGIWLGYSFSRWTRDFRRIEQALRGDRLDGLPELAPSQDAELNRIIAALNDYNARLKAAQSEAEGLQTSLERAERFGALGRMGASIAHEVRNPLAAIRLRTENALAKPSMREGALQAILREVERVEAIVKSLLTRAEPVNVHRREVDVRAWLESHAGAFQERCAAKGVTFEWESAIESCRFDPLALGRALDNLLDNALAHTPAGGTIRASASRSADASPMILRISDTGPGVPAHVKERLFEPFVSARPDGVGLGLALTREIAQAHGGQARHVAVGAGATFELEIPCAS